MPFDLSRIRNPILRPRPKELGARDATLVFHEGTLYCYYSGVWWDGETVRSNIRMTSTRDFVTWTAVRHVTRNPRHFWSPGNVFRVGGQWVMVHQSYPVPPGQKYGGPDCRLWLSRSDDLVNWGRPEPLNPGGAKVRWTGISRQIDGYIVPHDGRYWCLYKGSSWEAGKGGLGLMVSSDLRTWEEASPDRPVIGPRDTPDGSAVENPCVLKVGGEFRCFFAPCRSHRVIGAARSDDLLVWRDVRYLDVQEPAWLWEGFNAPFVLDMRNVCGKWLMVFHTDRDSVIVHTGIIGLAWSDDLEHWHCP